MHVCGRDIRYLILYIYTCLPSCRRKNTQIPPSVVVCYVEYRSPARNNAHRYNIFGTFFLIDTKKSLKHTFPQISSAFLARTIIGCPKHVEDDDDDDCDDDDPLLPYCDDDDDGDHVDWENEDAMAYDTGYPGSFFRLVLKKISDICFLSSLMHRL